MTFIPRIYALLLILTVIVYWFLGRSQTLKLGILLVVSLFIYASVQVQYIPLLLLLTLLNFYLGKIIAHQAAKIQQRDEEEKIFFPNPPNPARKFLIAGVILNILLLIGFKYIPFVLNSVAALLNSSELSYSANWVSDRLSAPLGISFFTFECIAYLIDVYRGAPSSTKILEFTSYKLFFPKLISGPITRYHYFQTQLSHLQPPTVDKFSQGCWLIVSGAVKKALIADHLAIFVDIAFGNLERAGSGDLWLTILAYGLQIYFDFSGYVDIARGSALLLGFNLPKNFDFPYFSISIADFWRRWHITLGDWLRNYLYFPLGGSRQGLPKTCLNLLIVMLLAGIWHGAAWGYVVWGAIHGISLAVHRLADSASQRWQWLEKWWQNALGIGLAWLITQFVVFFSWIFFRLPNLNQANLVLQHLVNYAGDIQFQQKVYGEALNLERHYLVWMVAIVILVMGLDYYCQKKLKLQLNWHIKLVIMPLVLLIVWLFAPEGGLPYIYFDF